MRGFDEVVGQHQLGAQDDGERHSRVGAVVKTQFHLVAGQPDKAATKAFAAIHRLRRLDARFEAGGALHYPADHDERALLIIEGEIQIGGGGQEPETHGPGAMLALEAGEEVTLYADAPARVMLLGGAALDGPRHIWWNFVSSSKDRIERAKQEWEDGTFGTIPGDDKEFIPLPQPRQDKP